MKNLSKPVAITIYVISFLLLVGLAVGNYYADKYSQIITTYLGHSNSEIVDSDDADTINSEYYKSDYQSSDEVHEYSAQVGQKIVEEGAVLLKNENDTLPLSAGDRISVLGQNSVDLIYGGGGSGSVDTSKAPDLLTVLNSSGFNVNETLWEFYDTGAGSSYRKELPDLYGEGDYAVNEVPLSDYTDDVMSSLEDYNDAAVVVIGRAGNESSDLTTESLSTGYHYLQLDDTEEEMLQFALDSFETVVVVLNTSNPMELGFLDEYDIDAALWIGALGQSGAYAIGEILNGSVNPSGRLVDTYAFDVKSAPAMANFGDFNITNSEVSMGNKYMVYGEGIYIGYRYYETRYEDVVLGNENIDNFDYESQVQFPFGYGLSYSTFEWSDYSVTEGDDTFEVSLTVTNTGSVSGKDVVQIYMQSPFTEYDKENNIEKASVELVGFAKTSELEAGESETVSIVVDKEEMKTYDAFGYGTFIVDAGDYYFAVGENAHDALNNILVAKGKSTEDGMTYEGNAEYVFSYTVENLDSTTYAVSQETGNEIVNQFDSADINYYDSSFEYLSRRDWTGTWPSTYADGAMSASDDLLADLIIPSIEESSDAVMPEMGKISEDYGKLNVAMFVGLDYDDELWDVLLDQITLDEMTELVRMGGYATVPIPSINLPGTINRDGPAGISDRLAGGRISAMAFPVQTVLASTWNVDLVEEMGRLVGEDSIHSDVAGWYAPGVNLHRLPFGGRNFEYFSEDNFLSGQMGASIVAGAQSKGAFTTVKHFALNEQDTNRIGGAIFANEQSIRELYLKPFEITVREANVSAAMASLNRIGARWSGAHEGLMTETLRNEWGFEGLVVTDQASFSVFEYQDIIAGQEAGTNLWLNTDSSLWTFDEEDLTPTVVNNIRKSTKDILYTIVNSHAMNGMSSSSQVVPVTPLWKYWLLGANILVGLLALSGILFVTRRLLKQKKITVS